MTQAVHESPRVRRVLTVLIVDDHPVVREGLRALINARDIAVVGETATAQEALEQVRRLHPDVVLMDIRLPDMDGLSATEAIKKEDERTSVIIVTSYDSREYLDRALEAGASGFLLKGMPPEAFVEAIRTVRAGGSIIDANLLMQLVRERRLATAAGQTSGEAWHALDSLTEQERQVLRLIARGLTNKEIAQRMHYSVSTVKNIVHRIIEKLGVADRTQAAVLAARAGLADQEA